MPVSNGTRRASPGKFARRWLYLIHRWVGIVSCLLFAMWFLSGLVMIYVPYPSLSKGERLAGAESIDWDKVTAPPPIGNAMPRHLQLEMRDGIPVWRIEGWGGRQDVVSAATGADLHPVDAPFAVRVAGRFAKTRVMGVEKIERDQWTVSGGFDRHRPLWAATMADADRTVLYISSSTGEVVQRTTGSARFWNWVGSVPHWLYPTILRQNQSAWRQVVLWVSGPCIAGALTGLWIGILRTRLGKRRFKHGRVTPYHGWMLWHHVAGLVGGLFLLSWIFSGWLSVDPGHLFRERSLNAAAIRHYASAAPIPPFDPPRIGRFGQGTKQMELTDFAGRPLLVLFHGDGSRDIYDATTLTPATMPQSAIVASARALVPEGQLIAVERLEKPDSYWYEAGSSPPLPVLRLRFDDSARTWLHIDPATGEILGMLDDRRRLYRWMFDLLHKWDVEMLTRNRPLWDGLLWVLSALGLIISISGIWIGWHRLRGGPARSHHR